MYERYESIFADLEPPFAFVDLDALWSNGADMLARAGGKPIRVASKSVRCRPLLRRILDRDPGFNGLLNLTLPEALWLWRDGFRDLVVAYPWTGRAALRELAAIESGDGPVVMVDCVAQLDLIAGCVAPGGPPVRVCIDLDVGYRRPMIAKVTKPHACAKPSPTCK